MLIKKSNATFTELVHNKYAHIICRQVSNQLCCVFICVDGATA